MIRILSWIPLWSLVRWSLVFWRRLVGRQLSHWQPIQRTWCVGQVLAATMQIDHRRGETGVPQQPTDCQQVHARLQQAGRVRMPQHVRINVLANLRSPGGRLDRFADRRNLVPANKEASQIAHRPITRNAISFRSHPLHPSENKKRLARMPTSHRRKRPPTQANRQRATQCTGARKLPNYVQLWG